MLVWVKPFPSPGGRHGAARGAVKTTAWLTAAGAGLGVYALVEPYRFRLNRIEVPWTGADTPWTVLHISDTHMRRKNKRLHRWLIDLPGLLEATPDMILATGDLIEDDDGIEPIVDALGGLQSHFGCFYVLGSHDFFQSEFQAYTKYFTGRRPVHAPRADAARLEAGLMGAGWKPVTNSTEVVETDGGRVRVTGVDDPYIHRDRTDHIGRETGDSLALGLVHAPDVVSDYALAGFDLVVAGHTHAGQVQVPGIGAVVTNCTIPTGLAAGLNRVGDTWLHVSPGLGTGRFAPIRFNCRPEATLLKFLPAGVRAGHSGASPRR